MRFNIIRQLYQAPEGLTPQDVYGRISPFYAGEKQCSVQEIDRQLMSLKTVGLVQVACTEIGPGDELESTYQLTGYGANRAQKMIGKYLA